MAHIYGIEEEYIDYYIYKIIYKVYIINPIVSNDK